MKPYIGVKVINAKPMTRLEYNSFRGWDVPTDENPDDEGFLVEYTDGGKANTKAFVGYVSWSPKTVFEKAYRQIKSLNFGLAVEAMKQGAKVSRSGWNGKNMHIQLVSMSTLPPGHLPYIEMKTVDDKRVPWLASQTDLLAEDWSVVND
jgi:hypothetical protein